MTVTCSIVCYNNELDQVSRLLDSLGTSGVEIRTYVIDNSATPRLEDLARKFGAMYLHRPDNPGYGRAHNLAIGDAVANGSRYHLVLNPDIHFSREVLPALLDYMDSHWDIGILAPRVQFPNGEPQYLCKLLPNPFDMLLRRFCPPLHRYSGRRARYELRHTGYDKVMEVPALSGCFMLIRTSALRMTGAFDERYFMYFEDVDLTRRIGAIARTVYYPHVTIVHEYAKGSYKNPRLFLHHVRSAVRYFNKWGWLTDSDRNAINGAVMRNVRRSLRRQA